MADDVKITQVTITDVRGENHTLRSVHGLVLDRSATGGIHARTKPPAKGMAITFMPDQWMCFRAEYEQ